MGDEAFIAWMRYFVREKSRILEHIYLRGYIYTWSASFSPISEYRINIVWYDDTYACNNYKFEIRRWKVLKYISIFGASNLWVMRINNWKPAILYLRNYYQLFFFFLSLNISFRIRTFSINKKKRDFHVT